MFKTLIATTVMLVGMNVAMATPPSKTVQAVLVTTVNGNPGETEQAFAVRVASTVLKDYTDSTHTEACGPIAKKPDGTFVVQLTSEESQVLCFISTTAPDGSTLVGDSIHSHPSPTHSGDVLLTAKDHAVFKAIGDYDMAERSVRYLKSEPCGFSDDDIAGGHGYLQACGKVYYQNGKDTQTVVADDSTPQVASK